MIDSDRRRTIADLKRQIKEIEAPEREARKIARAKDRQKRETALVRGFGQRQPRVRNNAFLAFLRRQPCLACGKTPSDAAHVRFVPQGSGWRHVGKGEKPDDLGRAVPLCRAHHEQQHSMRESHFWYAVLQMDPVETCARLAREFEGQEP